MSGLPGVADQPVAAVIVWLRTVPVETLAFAAVVAALQTSLIAGAMLLAERATRSRWPALGAGLVALALAKFAMPFWLAWHLLPAGAGSAPPLLPVQFHALTRTKVIPQVWIAVAAIWAAGSVFALARIGIERRRLARRLAATRACQDPAVLGVLESASRRAGLRTPPPLHVSNDGTAPFVAGAFAPTIVVPARWLERLSPADLETVLLHEAMHVRFRDVLKLELVALLAAWWWWNPVYRTAAARWRATLEDRCDDGVTALLRGGAEAYGRALLRAARLAIPVHATAVAGTAGLAAQDVERRLRRMMTRHPGSRRRGRWVTAVLVAVGLVALPFVGRAPSAPRPAAAPPAANASPAPSTPSESHAARHARLHAQRHAPHVHVIPVAP